MASSPTSIENQIDSFLEQFKRSASRAMEDTGQHPPPVSSGYNACGSSSISRSRSGNLDLEMLDAGEFVCSIATRSFKRPIIRMAKRGSVCV